MKSLTIQNSERTKKVEITRVKLALILNKKKVLIQKKAIDIAENLIN